MTARQIPDEQALADRLVNYADALIALSMVGVSGLGIAAADPDIRESLETAAEYIIAVNVVTGVIVSGLIIILRKWETDLRSDWAPSPKTVKYSRYLHIARITVVWLAAVQAVMLMMAIM